MVSADGSVVVQRLRVANGFLQRLRGLMFHTLEPGQGLLIPRCSGVHTCFMRMPVDVLFLSPAGVVVQVVKEMPPWRVSPLVRGAAHVLECFPGTAHRYGLTPGTSVFVYPG
ncbi:MAG: DUF192 domain-containing protein [Alicyclobacillus sp.]|nr:DUF192 domain-containing protein [Alicyclobacillus sp.]